ncbi:hypothetical protein BOKEGFJH_00436 [Chlamydia avium]|uniref:Uncharacterized protein n=1 Tax=Chlamydia avium TaxID=1457141 RepID=A0ABN0MRJ3_9CHLA|nr:hypothetical protein [Chlamydia avium]EPP37382.1 hypothetical protein CP10743SC13_0778 [Chlamydia psittaci 10_743_SC13]EPP38085.1 hypothetical protein CP10881SC42_0860 [Chlamydia avium]VVT42913.1 hypothetical protein BOKEGFJH_00436 [Chlamydia avium]
MCLTGCLASTFEYSLHCICFCEESQKNKRIIALIFGLVLGCLAIIAITIFILICTGTITVPSSLCGMNTYILTPILLATALITASLSSGCLKVRYRFSS